jgi:hypothetical protein
VKKLEARLAVLERRQPVGCETCRFWHRTIVVTLDADGNETGASRPEVCPDCGRWVPIGHVLQIVGVDWDVL